MGKFYGFPLKVNTGYTDSKRVDAQAGLEAGITLMVSAAAGADHFGDMGISGVDQAASLDMLVFQHEVISFVESVMREVEISDETLALDEIIEVGPGGRFIDREHTIRHFKKELWFPTLLDRRYYQQWLDSGAIGTEQRVRERRDEILRTHVPEPISPELERALDEVVAAARRDLTPK
jgi:trimethylamine--corrinoid protein Co-methyltransferase